MTLPNLDSRPIILAIAGPNGAGKTTFYNAFLKSSGLRYINADDLARNLSCDPYEAAKIAATLREELLRQKESFIFETVFSDPSGDKIAFLQKARAAGYTTVLCYIGIPSAKTSDDRVAMRLTQGGHDVPLEKLKTRFPRTLANLKTAIGKLPLVLIFDNGNLSTPFRPLASFTNGTSTHLAQKIPAWLKNLL